MQQTIQWDFSNRPTDPKDRFEQFHNANPHVYVEILKRSTQLKNVGVRVFGMQALLEAMRFDYTIRTAGGDFKLNNDHAAFYSRKLMIEHNEFRGMFHLRKSVADRYPEYQLKETHE